MNPLVPTSPNRLPQMFNQDLVAELLQDARIGRLRGRVLAVEAREIAAEQQYVDEVYVQLEASTRSAKALAAEGLAVGVMGGGDFL